MPGSAHPGKNTRVFPGQENALRRSSFALFAFGEKPCPLSRPCSAEDCKARRTGFSLNALRPAFIWGDIKTRLVTGGLCSPTGFP